MQQPVRSGCGHLEAGPPMNRKPYDPLADHFARGRIGQAQFWAGREFQEHFGIADRRSEDRAYTLDHLERERPGTLTDDQLAAWKWLAKCYRQLGADGSALFHDVLIRAMTAKQIVESRGRTGQGWERYFTRRFWECLNTLAAVYGFSKREKRIRAADGNAEEPCLTRRSPADSERLPARPGQIAGRQQQVVWGPRARGGSNPYCT